MQSTKARRHEGTKARRGWLAGASLVILTGCAESGDQGTKVVKNDPLPPPLMTFQLSTSGLPETGMWKCDPTLGDVNGDGHLDLAAIPRLGPGPHVWLGDGNGNWQVSSEGLRPDKQSCGGGVAFGDVNHDGLLDLVAADHCHGVSVYLGNGQGGWRTVTEALNPQGIDTDVTDPNQQMFVGTEDVTLGDVNGDGHLDLVTGASDDGGVHLYLGDGSGTVWDRTECGLPPEGWANRVELVDLDGDDLLDVAVSYGDGPRVWLQKKSDEGLSFEASSEGLPSPMMRGIYTGLSVGDVNEDGLPDLALANWVDGPEVYLQEAGVKWRKASPVFPAMGGGAVGLTLGRIDDDRHLDIVVSGRLAVESGFVRGVFVLRGNGKGEFEQVERSGLPETGLAATTGVTVGDVNGDGILDVVASSGLIVETVPGGPTQPDIASRILVWTTSLPAGPEKNRLPNTPVASGQ